MKQRVPRLLSLLLAFVLMLAVFPLSLIAQEARVEDEPSEEEISRRAEEYRYYEKYGDRSALLPFRDDGTMPVKADAIHTPDEDFSTVRVLMNFECEYSVNPIHVTSILFNLHGAYYIDQNLAPIVGTISQPAIVRMTAAGGIVSVFYGGELIYSGPTVDINRVLLSISGGYAKLVTTPTTACSDVHYLGNFRITAYNGNKLRIVSHVPTLHYLYGIVPYEMNDGWGIEALRCQAITAKSYAFAYFPASDDYDISASKAHQWYRGFKIDEAFPNSLNACIASLGEMLFCNGRVVRSFYGATNGGETNLPSYTWPGNTSHDAPYSIVLDSFDLRYDHPYMLRLNIHYGEPIENAIFRSLISEHVTEALGHSAQLLSIIHADVNTRAYPDTALNLTKLDLIVRVNDGGTERSVALSFDVHLLDESEHGVFQPENDRNLRIFWGHEIPNGYCIRHGRYGTGIGLAQNAAKGRCMEGQDHYEIIDYYFPNAQILNVAERNPELPNSYSKLPAAFGSVSAGSARLRSGPSTNHSVLETLPANTHVDVITEVNGWLVCIVNNKLGYIRGDLVNVTYFPSPEGGDHPIGYSSVKTGVLDAELMSGPSEYSAPIINVYPGYSMEVWYRVGNWYYVRFAGRYAFIHASKITEPYYGYLRVKRFLT